MRATPPPSKVVSKLNLSVVLLSFLLFVCTGEQAVFLGFMNAFVHVVMYSYYFLAALGERVRPYLWWKKYLTALQIVIK